MSLKFCSKTCFSKEHARIYYINFGRFINFGEMRIFLSNLRWEIQLSAEQTQNKPLYKNVQKLKIYWQRRGNPNIRTIKSIGVKTCRSENPKFYSMKDF